MLHTIHKKTLSRKIKNQGSLVFVLLVTLIVEGGYKMCCAADGRLKIVPGVVVNHSPASSGQFIGSPSLVVLTNGDYLAAHDFFGPKSGCSRNGTTIIFKSSDRGLTWHKTAYLSGTFWGNLFLHDGMVYLMGVNKEYGDIIIRRSNDGGNNWTTPKDTDSGRLTERGKYHTAPVPVVEHAGKLWRAFEDASDGKEWGKRFRAGMISIPAGANLLNATNWTFSNFMARDGGWLDGRFNAWLEGNAVVTREGWMADVLRVDTLGFPEKAAVVRVADDGKEMHFSPTNGFVDFPGGAKKFTIRFDEKGGCYWSLASVASPDNDKTKSPGGIRNTLALIRSRDLYHWEVRAVLLHNADADRHGFQYADWQFEGDDIIAAVRTAFDDNEGGAHNYHDTNFLIFCRWNNFRELTAGNDLKTASN